MPLVLGLDAAWTPTGSSGVALVDTDHQLPRVVAMAPGYHALLRLVRGEAVDWSARPAGGEPPLEELVRAAEALASKPVDVITVDIPLSHEPITGRRPADRAISAAFGGRGCSTHSPLPERPGPISEAIRAQADRLGFPLITTVGRGPPAKALLETYPHPALLHLTGAGYRIPYKVDKRRRYWPEQSPGERRVSVCRKLSFILRQLEAELADIDLAVDETAPVRTLKAVEDVIDALVCCWVGARWLSSTARPYGDATAAIWLPHPPTEA